MNKLVSVAVISLAVLAMLLPVMHAVNLSISNAPYRGQVLTAQGNPKPLPPLPPIQSEWA
jgi:hypothetical protein